MARVDPYVIQPPAAWMLDPEVAAWVAYDNLWKHDMWVKTGGGEDIINNITSSESFETSLSVLEALERADDNEQIEDLIPIVRYRDFRTTIATSNVTAVNNVFVEGRNGITITMDPNAQYNDQIITGNGDSSLITIDSGIIEMRHAGRRDTKFSITNEGTKIHWYLFVSGAEKYWSSA